MLKKLVTFLFTLLAAALLYWYWPGEEPDLPVTTDIVSLTVNDQTNLSGDELIDLLAQLQKGRKSRLSSVNDAPSGEYIKLTFTLADGQDKIAFLYKGWLSTYFELPYEGIYRVSPDFPETIVQ